LLVKAADQVSIEVVQIGIDDNGNPRPFFTVPKDPTVADDGDNLAGLRVARHVRETLKADGTWMVVEPAAGDRLEHNLNPVGRMYYSGSTMICIPTSLDQPVGAAFGAQAGFEKLSSAITEGGFAKVRKATETPFNMILEASA
jgi:hypothetical protein